MKNHINEKFGVFYYSFSQKVKTRFDESVSRHNYKVEIRKSSDKLGYVIEIKDIMLNKIIEIIETDRFESDNSRQTLFYGKKNNRQAVIMWDAPITVGLAKTNVRGFELLVNYFDQEKAISIEPSPDNALEFLRSSAPLVREIGYNHEDIWGRMRYCMIQYILRFNPNYRNRISFISNFEINSIVDHSDIFDCYLGDTLEMISEECDRCAKQLQLTQYNLDHDGFISYEKNLTILSGVYMTLLLLLGI